MRSARVTTGVKGPTETGPKARINATRPEPVTMAVISSCKPTLPGDSRCAAMPDPTTMATSNAVPRASAVNRRAKSRSTPATSAAAGGRFRRRGAALVVGAGFDGAQLSAGHLGVGEDGVDLPRLTVGRVDPHLVLDRVAAGHLVLGRGREPLVGEAGLGGRYVGGVGHLDAEVVQRPRRAVALHEDQLQRGGVEGEVRVTRPQLGRRGVEELRVEGDRRVEVGHVERQLDPCHHAAPWYIRFSRLIYPREYIDACQYAERRSGGHA